MASKQIFMSRAVCLVMNPCSAIQYDHFIYSNEPKSVTTFNNSIYASTFNYSHHLSFRGDLGPVHT